MAVGGWGVRNVGKTTPFFFGSKTMNLLGFFSDSERKKCFWVPIPESLYGAEWVSRSSVTNQCCHGHPTLFSPPSKKWVSSGGGRGGGDWGAPDRKLIMGSVYLTKS